MSYTNVINYCCQYALNCNKTRRIEMSKMRKRIDCMREGHKVGSMKGRTSSIKRKEEENNISPEKISKGPLSSSFVSKGSVYKQCNNGGIPVPYK